ncbi:MAG: response regulator [Candidatus Magasanikbacteria bacterium]|uniref:Response regulatory domain-containing protein n=1 Tax=Candidatus Magasanikbacteria bacterium CG10_big_fil_rev_8_21_14_0_10_38_6 TaxID=1974647 RepID=A0A2M6P316_9BACT|nr:response regulator [Candidatus Magasanikbacteria bacterium]NCS72154.1 response regulator [Candidatus Magasanikbacteria bacterium]PIR77800.1 MAG: hypothetical protein COU30_00495 [Candidatus Magasanikbacteria bacterium CG10_big_fil_rev_8_21_14_0_10_38_6]
MHILIVDDEAIVRDSLSRYMRRGGHTIDLASNCEEALALLNGDVAFDAVIIDGLNGRWREVAEAAKQKKIHEIVGHSGDQQFHEEMLASGIESIVKGGENAAELFRRLK